MTTLERVNAAIEVLNAHYGYGDVQQIRMYFDGRIEFTVQGFHMLPAVRIGHLRNDTVYALKHQRKLA